MSHSIGAPLTAAFFFLLMHVKLQVKSDRPVLKLKSELLISEFMMGVNILRNRAIIFDRLQLIHLSPNTVKFTTSVTHIRSITFN